MTTAHRAPPGGPTLAGARFSRGTFATRTSIRGEPRGPLCGMGTCFECRLSIDGELVRSCRAPAERSPNGSSQNGMRPGSMRAAQPRELLVDIAVIGGGPAGLAAAASAGASGRRVALIDDNPDTGGQIWRRDGAAERGSEARRWHSACEDARVHFERGATLFDAPNRHELWIEAPSGPLRVRAERLILATGSRELFLPFPGWTLPGVVGAGGLQALAKTGFDVSGRRIVIAGSGPLLLAVAAHVRKKGAEVVVVAEQAPRRALARLGLELLGHPQKLRELGRLERALFGVPRHYRSFPSAAHGSDKLEAVTLVHSGRPERIRCDVLAVGFGLVPEVALGVHLGCALELGALQVDALQATSVDRVFAAGECTGIGGAELAVLEGRIAGLAAAERTEDAKKLWRARERGRRFSAALTRAFRLRGELRSLASDDTVICRCEDVPLGAVRRYETPRYAKLQTRLGMGPCQGRVCGPALEFLLGWPSPQPRSPFFPTSLEAFAAFGARVAPVAGNESAAKGSESRP